MRTSAKRRLSVRLESETVPSWVRTALIAFVLIAPGAVQSQDRDDASSAGDVETPGDVETRKIIKRVEEACSLLRTDVKAAAESAEEILRDTKQMSPPLEAMTRWIAGAGLVRTGQPAKAIVHLDRGVEIAREIKHVSQLRRLLRYVAAACYELNEFQRGRDAASEALELTDQIKGARKDSYHALILNELGGCETKLGHLDAAAKAFTEALQIAKAEDNPDLQSMLLVNLVDIYGRLNRFDQAEEICRDALARCVDRSVPHMIATAKLNLGTVLWKQEKLEEARRYFTEVIQLPRERQLHSIILTAMGHLGQMEEDDGRLAEAGDYYTRSHKLALSMGDGEAVVDFAFRLQRVNGLVDEQADLQRTMALRQRARQSGDMNAWIDHTEDAIQALQKAGDFQQVSTLLVELREQEQSQWSEGTAQAIAALEQEVDTLKAQRDESKLQHQQELFELQRVEANARFRWMALLALTFAVGLLVAGIMLVQLRRALHREREAIATIRDQEQQQAALELKMMDEEKVSSLKLLAGGIVHDFNNLLAVITTSADCGSVSQTSTEAAETFETIAEAAKQASALTNQLVQYLGGHPPQDRATALGPVTSQMKSLLESVINGRAELKVLDATAGECVAIDDSEARQVLVNLVSNAAESMDKQGLISAEIRRVSISTVSEDPLTKLAPDAHFIEQLEPGEYCRLTVSDNGSGMEESTLKRVFDPYFSTKKTGHGLGMASVHGIVKGRNGCVAIRSKRHLGTTVDVFLPVVSRPQECSTSKNQAVDLVSEAETAESNTDVVLLVEDDPMVSAMIQRVLEQGGYTVHTAENAQLARQRFRSSSSPYNCVIADFSMPGEDGMSFLRWVREQYPEIRTVLCSGFHERTREYDSSVDLCLQKPFRSSALLAAVRRSDSLV